MPEEKYVDNRYSHQQEQNEEHKSQLIKQGGGKQRLVGTFCRQPQKWKDINILSYTSWVNFLRCHQTGVKVGRFNKNLCAR